MKLLFLIWIALSSLGYAAEAAAVRGAICASKLRTLFECAGQPELGSELFNQTLFKKAEALGSREKMMEWICDSSAKHEIAFRMVFVGSADRGSECIFEVSEVEGGRSYVGKVQFRYDKQTKLWAVVSCLRDYGPVE